LLKRLRAKLKGKRYHITTISLTYQSITNVLFGTGTKYWYKVLVQSTGTKYWYKQTHQ